MAEANSLYYMRARYYDPEVRRFISEDPAGFGGGDLNLYAYVGGNPMVGVDPSGLATYRINRELGGSSSRSPCNLLTHTYVFTTDSNGNVENTYSWGNTYDENNNGVWHKNGRPEDLVAAREGLKNGDAVLVGGDQFDQHVDKAFSTVSQYGNSHEWSLFNNCKHEANRLLDMASSYASDSLKSGSHSYK